MNNTVFYIKHEIVIAGEGKIPGEFPFVIARDKHGGEERVESDSWS